MLALYKRNWDTERWNNLFELYHILFIHIVKINQSERKKNVQYVLYVIQFIMVRGQYIGKCKFLTIENK